MYLQDFKDMKKGTYIKNKLFDYLDPLLKDSLQREVKFYTNKLKEDDTNIKELLKYMNILFCIKKCLEMSVNIIGNTDARNKTLKRLQARGRVTIDKGVGVTASYCLGVVPSSSDFKNDLFFMIEGRSQVVKRALKSLKEMYGLIAPSDHLAA